MNPFPRAFYRIEKVMGPMPKADDAEAVVQALYRSYPGHRYLYRDTMGFWDELCHDGPHFTGFSPGRLIAKAMNLT